MIRTVIRSPTKPGAFAVVRCGIGFPTTTETDGFGTMASASAYADRLNREYDRQQAASAVLALAPVDRPIPAGFYSDQDAR